MNLFKNYIVNTKLSGMILPTAVIFTFVSMMVTMGYMERVLNKKINLDLRIAKTKARLNAESGVSITIAGPTSGGEFMPALGSSDWPVTDDVDDFNADIIDTETFAGYYKPENTTSFFPNAGIVNTPDINMGEFYNITLEAYENDITRRPERSATAYGRSKVKNIWGEEIYMVDSSRITFTVEVLSDFMYLTHHEKAGGAPAVYGPQFGNSNERRQPCFGSSDALGSDEQSLVGFVQTLDPMRICSAFPLPTFDNLVYITRATNNQYTNPPYWVDSEYNITNVAEGDSILPDFSICGCDEDDIFLSDEGPEIHPNYEVKDPVCFPLQGYKETVLSAADTYDATEMLRASNSGNLSLKDTLIMTDIEFLSSGGYRVKRWWYLMPPHLRGDIKTPFGIMDPEPDSNGDGMNDILHPEPYHLEGMPTFANPLNPTNAECAQMNALYDGNINCNPGAGFLQGDISRATPYKEALHDFSSLLVTSNGTQAGNMTIPTTYNEQFNTFYSAGNYNAGTGLITGSCANAVDCGPGGGVTRLSHYDIENFSRYFSDKGWNDATYEYQMNEFYGEGGNLLTDEIITHPEGSEIIIYVKGGPVRVHGVFKGAYTVVTSGWDAVGGNNCLSDGCAGYDGYSTYRRHAWMFPAANAYPTDTIPTNIWVVDDLTNADAPWGGPPQPEIYDFWGDVVCDYEAPGDCGSSQNILGLVSAANVVVANSPPNRTGGIDLHASIVALNESFVMHYWQHARQDFCGNPPFDLNDDGQCVQTPPHADGRGRYLYGFNSEPANGRGFLRLWGGIIQSFRGYMMRNNGGGSQYPTADIGMDKDYNFDNNLYFPPPGAIKITECESNTIRMSMTEYGRPN